VAFLAALPPALLAAMVGGGASVATGLLGNRESESTKSAKSAATRQSEAETQSIEQRVSMIEGLFDEITSRSGSRPPAFQFGENAGGPANDLATLEGIPNMAGINLLMQLAGMSTSSTGATGQLLNQGAFEGAQGRESIGGIGSDLSFIIAELLRGGGGDPSTSGVDPAGLDSTRLDPLLLDPRNFG